MRVLAVVHRVLIAALIFLPSAIPAGDGRGSSASSKVRFDVPDLVAQPTDLVTVPVAIQADEPISMATFSLEFDASVLEFVELTISPEVMEIIERRLGIPGVDWQLESFFDNEAGWVQVSLVLDFEGREGFSIPPRLFTLSSLTFHVKAEAPEGRSALSFTRPEGAGYEGHFQAGERRIYNAARRSGHPFTQEDRFQENVDADLDDGAILVSIIGDVGIFVRGDSNGDDAVDISDPIATLGFLFGEGILVPCEDAADSNDDGRIDISDPIDTLSYLFDKGTGSARNLTLDDTIDALDCAR